MIREDPNIDRNICLYGWVRGSYLKNQSSAHIPGVGDFRIDAISALPDPCPFPNQQAKRSLNQKERVVYAPFSGLGSIVYDKDAIYIETGGAQAYQQEVIFILTSMKSNYSIKQQKSEIIEAIGQTSETMDEQIRNSSFKLLKDSADIEAVEESDDEAFYSEENGEDEFEEESESAESESESVERLGRGQMMDGMKVIRTHTGDYSGLQSKATNLFSFNRDERIRWKHVIYGAAEEETESDDDDLNVGGLLKRAKKSSNLKKQAFKDREDGFCYLTPSSSIFGNSIDWADEDQRELIRNCFITGENDQDSNGDENDMFDEEDLKMEVDDEEFDDSKISDDEQDQVERSKRLEEKEKLKARFNAEYDEHNEAYNMLKEENDAQAKVRN